MRILMVSAAVLPIWSCGVSTVIDQLRRELVAQGHTIAYFSLDCQSRRGMNSDYEKDGVQYYITAVSELGKRFYVSDDDPNARHVNERFVDCLRIFKPDVVHFHTPQYFSLELIDKAHQMGARTIVTLHDWWWICPRQFFAPKEGMRCIQRDNSICAACVKKIGETDKTLFEWRQRLTLAEKSIDRFVCVSEIVMRDLLSEKPYLQEKTEVIPNAVCTSGTGPSKIEGPMKFAFLGGMSELKGYHCVWKCFQELESKIPWQLYIYGCESPQLSLRRCFHLVKKGISHPVRFLRRFFKKLDDEKRRRKTKENHIFHLPPFQESEREMVLHGVQVVIVFSLVQESFSLVAHEAMANGCCVITTQCGGPLEIVQDGINGVVLDTATDEALAYAVRRMISHPDKVEELRKNAYLTSHKFSAPNQMAQKYLCSYSKGRSRA